MRKTPDEEQEKEPQVKQKEEQMKKIFQSLFSQFDIIYFRQLCQITITEQLVGRNNCTGESK